MKDRYFCGSSRFYPFSRGRHTHTRAETTDNVVMESPKLSWLVAPWWMDAAAAAADDARMTSRSEQHRRNDVAGVCVCVMAVMQEWLPAWLARGGPLTDFSPFTLYSSHKS